MRNSKDLFPSPWRQIEKEMDAFFRSSLDFIKESMPHTFHVRETKNEYIIEGNLPGFKKDQIKITQEGKKLSITAENQEDIEMHDENQRVYRRQSSYGKVQQTFLLPQSVNMASRQVNYTDEHLIIRFKKQV